MKIILSILLLFFVHFAYAQIFDTLVVNGETRTYIKHVPPGLPSGAAVVLVLHGFTQTANDIQQISGMNAIADSVGFAVLYPQGLNNGWNTLSGFPGGSQADDVNFIKALVDAHVLSLGCDPQKVFSCGFSAGGYMSHLLKCSLPGVFRSIASVAGTMSPSAVTVCSAAPAVPFLHIHGTSDAVVSYQGSVFSGIGVDSLIRLGLQVNGCSSEPQIQAFPNIVLNDASTASLYRYEPCISGARVHLIRVDGGGHTWPGTTSSISGVGALNMDFNASLEIWKFFAAQVSLKTSLSASIAYIQVYPNPASDFLFISGRYTRNDLKLYSATGQFIATDFYETDFGLKISISHLPNGLYYLSGGGVGAEVRIQK
jgi:polyhydroxybutyrate depolymerase